MWNQSYINDNQMKRYMSCLCLLGFVSLLHYRDMFTNQFNFSIDLKLHKCVCFFNEIWPFWHIYIFFFHNEACNETNSQLEFQSFSSSFKHHCPMRCIIIECIVKDRHSSCSKDEKQQNKCCLYHLWSLSLHILGMVSNTYTPIYISHV